MTDKLLTTPRLVLRTIRPGDADDIYRHIADWDVVKMLAKPPWPYSRQDAIDYAASGTARVIELNGEVIGAIGIGKRAYGEAIGFWIGKTYWGRGFMSEAIRAAVQDFFARPEGKVLFSSFVADNVASWRVQAKIGFVRFDDGLIHIVSRGESVREIRTRLSREVFEETNRQNEVSRPGEDLH